jgi:hypothetical protein
MEKLMSESHRDSVALLAADLEKMGYSRQSFVFEYQTDVNSRVDMVVFIEKKPWIVAEVKEGEDFAPFQNQSSYRHNPAVRRVQALASLMNAPYFLISDGITHLWFSTDESGRPKRLETPIFPTLNGKSVDFGASKEHVHFTLRSLRDFFFQVVHGLQMDEIGLLLLAKILSERGDFSLVYDLGLITPDKNESFHKSNSRFHLSLKDYVDRRYLWNAYNLLQNVTLSALPPVDLLNILDELFLYQISKSSNPKVPRWISDLLTRLALFTDDDVIIDLASGYGDILAAVGLAQTRFQGRAKVWGFTNNPEQAIWAQLQQKIARVEGDVITEDALLVNLSGDFSLPDLPRPTAIVSAPSFGVRQIDGLSYQMYLASQGINQNEDLYLEVGIRMLAPGGRLVLLVPEGLLLSTKRRRTREFILAEMNVLSIISLSSDLLLPFSNIKTSILVLEKNKVKSPILMASITSVPPKDIFDSRTIPEVQAILNGLRVSADAEAETFRTYSENFWWVEPDRVNPDNLTVRYYESLNNVEETFSNTSFPQFRLEEITQLIKRGSSFKLDDQGEILVIGPGAIRPLEIDVENLVRTSEEAITGRRIIAEEGDILINNISMYLGATAVVNASVAGHVISQHVLLVRPNTSLVLPEYLAVVINSDFVKAQIKTLAAGTVIPALSVARLADLVIPLLSLEDQQRIIQRVNSAYNLVANARIQLDLSEKLLQELIRRVSL